MPTDPLQILPPDDSGSDAFARYRYQARLAVPYCLRCALGQDVVCVVPEHIEDIAIQFGSGWVFVQVKTRNANLGPWRLSHVLATGSGGMRALLRTFRALDGMGAQLELHLEGAVARDDLLQELLNPATTRSAELRGRICGALQLEEVEGAIFLSRLVVREATPRQLVLQENRGLIGEINPHLQAGTINWIEQGLVDEISIAMEGGRLGGGWPRHVIAPHAAPGDLTERISIKRLDGTRLERFRGALEARPLALLLAAEAGLDMPMTDLERKLRAGNARQTLIEHAKRLRSNAAMREIEILSKGSLARREQEQLEDTQVRLLTCAIGVQSQHGDEPNAAARIFNGLRVELRQQAVHLDPHGIYGQDPNMLLGAICGLSDECKSGWN